MSMVTEDQLVKRTVSKWSRVDYPVSDEGLMEAAEEIKDHLRREAEANGYLLDPLDTDSVYVTKAETDFFNGQYVILVEMRVFLTPVQAALVDLVQNESLIAATRAGLENGIPSRDWIFDSELNEERRQTIEEAADNAKARIELMESESRRLREFIASQEKTEA